MPEIATLSLASDPNIKGYYQFEGDSTDAGSTNDGTDTSITYDSSYGKFNQGALFNGTSSKMVFGSNLADWQFTGSFTICGWAQKIGGDGSAQALVSNIYDGASNDRGWSVQLNSSNQLIFTFGLGTSGFTTITSSGTITVDATWHHFAVVRDSNDYFLYIDGEIVGTAYNTTSYSYLAGTNSCVIGASYDPSYSKFWDGYIDDVALFNRALTLVEIRSIYSDDEVAVVTNANRSVFADSTSPTSNYNVAPQIDVGESNISAEKRRARS